MSIQKKHDTVMDYMCIEPWIAKIFDWEWHLSIECYDESHMKSAAVYRVAQRLCKQYPKHTQIIHELHQQPNYVMGFFIAPDAPHDLRETLINADELIKNEMAEMESWAHDATGHSKRVKKMAARYNDPGAAIHEITAEMIELWKSGKLTDMDYDAEPAKIVGAVIETMREDFTDESSGDDN
jgi:hypothetical protein